jgi:uncharacterized membrane protein
VRGIALAVLLAAPVGAETLPALFRVTGVAAGDVLNIRAEPSAGAAILGGLPPDAAGVEVVAERGGWGLVSTGEGAGWVKLSFLARQPDEDWFALTQPLRCLGTEPFWSLGVEPATRVAVFSTPEAGDAFTTLTTLWPGEDWWQEAAFALPDGFATLTGGECSDGMSDRAFGIAIKLYRMGDAPAVLQGCCSLAP